MKKAKPSRIDNHPYAQMPASSFWKTAVSGVAVPTDLWTPKFNISQNSRIITAGSCFAAHISTFLKREGFNWIDSEPAPDTMSEEDRASGGYGVFSFRTGNIYTPALLNQWIRWANHIEEFNSEYIVDDGRIFDPFRPAIPKNGYTSVEELIAARRKSCQAIHAALATADVFIFTLGLTEAWKNRNGVVYPVCPGTIRGRFSEDDHYFHNFSYSEILEDMIEASSNIRKINPEIKFLITVSPVPLTATATDKHVLLATTYSKSVLRAVAGYLSDTIDYFDYFPSYEIISSPPFKAMFFEDNMRSVKPNGVDFVMENFLSGLNHAVGSMAVETTPSAQPPTSARVSPARAEPDVDDVCEDILLESWNAHASRPSVDRPKYLLVGDCQMTYLSKAFDHLGVPHVGGGMLAGNHWHGQQFTVDDNHGFLPSARTAGSRLGMAAEDHWKKTFNDFLVGTSSCKDKASIITNIGMHTYAHSDPNSGFGAFLNSKDALEHDLYDNLLRYLRHARWKHIEVIVRFKEFGYNVIVVTDPPFERIPPSELEGLYVIEKVMCTTFKELANCTVFNARTWLNQQSEEWVALASPRPMNPGAPEHEGTWWNHATPEYYEALAKELLKI